MGHKPPYIKYSVIKTNILKLFKTDPHIYFRNEHIDKNFHAEISSLVQYSFVSIHQIILLIFVSA
jgi:intein-encoded DNA endonuclease-like protein